MAADDRIGSLVDGRYKVLEAMASGSMGAVYKAERIPVGKLVAIKFLHAAFATESEFLTRFERETRVMSKLAHPNCVSVVDFGVFEDAPYIVMDYVAGVTLRTILDDGPLEPMRALRLARQIAAGLAHAHAQGVTHRDVKPANIMVTQEIGTGDHARILDFGLARLRGATGRDATQSNVVVGTPNYMAPEQTVGGGTIDARTDVYAVGVVLFEMIAGERPFQAEDTLALLGMHRAAPIPKLIDRVGKDVDIPDGVQQLVEKAMAKAPDDRYQSAIELAEAIDVVGGTVNLTFASIQSSQSRRPRTDPRGLAPTQVDVEARARSAPPMSLSRPEKKKGGGTLMGVALVLLLLGGGAYAAWYFKNRTNTVAAVDPVDATHSGGHQVAPPPTVDAVDAVDAVEAVELPDAAVEVVALDAAVAIDASVEDAAAVPDAPVAIEVPADADAGSNGDEIEMDPETAENVSPTPAPEAEDEAEDAPKTSNDAEKRAPAPPVRHTPTYATNIHDAVRMIKRGENDLAIASLTRLRKKYPKSAYIPFLLGNLYFDKLWWTVAMDNYRVAIAKNGGYRKNPTLNRNIIRMLLSKKTVGRADYFLKRTIGRPALPYLKYVAAHDKNSYLRKYAGNLAKFIGSR